jgi:hypothetical protein
MTDSHVAVGSCVVDFFGEIGAIALFIVIVTTIN